jgi:DNA-binding PadR family transcriptional regulator
MRDTLGEFELMVLLAILHLGEDVYGVPIVDEIARRTGREAAPAAVYVTLRRLEEKGMLASWMGESTGERGGKARRYVRVTRAGLESLRASRKALDSMCAASTSICELRRDDATRERGPVQSPARRASGRRARTAGRCP